ncbi:MAG: hypothetical protein EBS18_05130 [Actinobacteria bacterium]|nr:hypothetical protein [Actinomycetota bacterium]
MALVDTRKAKTGVFSAGRAAIAERTLRTDKWWIQPLLIIGALVAFIIYATFRAFEGKHYFVEPLISPFYSPCLSTVCVDGASLLGTPIGKIVIFGIVISPALFILVFPLGFRMTCYYYRKSYYRSFWASPSACAVAEPHKTYTGETRAPLILQNSHRYFFYAGLVFNVLLTVDAVLAFKNAEGQWGHMSVGTLVLLANATFLWLYSASCHTCRHTIGGRLRHFSKHPVRYKAWSVVSKLNHYHPNFAWVSLVGVAFADFYVRQVSTGAFTNWYFF